MEGGVKSKKILYANVANLALYIKCKESHLAILSISTLGISRVRPYINLAALQCSDSRARNPSLLVKLPHIGNAYDTEGKIILKCKSGNILRGKKELRCSKFNLLTKLFFSSKICWDHVSLWRNFRMEISVQNSVDRFGLTGKVSKKLVHLLRWSTFPGRTGLNLGWMDRAHAIQYYLETRGPFLESPGNFSGPKSNIQIEI